MGRTHLTCRRCGFGVPADAPLCPGCHRPAIDDWKARSRSISAVERQARRLDPPLRDAGYRSLLRSARFARLGLGATAATAAAAIVLHAGAAVRPTGGAADEVSALVTASRGALVALLALVAVTALAFVAWAVTAYRNLPALGITDRRYWTIWLIIGWVIPGANLLVPKLVVDDIWRASSPSVPLDAGDRWQRRPVASLVNRWWCSFLLTPAIAVLAVVAARDEMANTEHRLLLAGAAVTAAAAVATAAIAARRLVAVVTVAQARRADMVMAMRADADAAARHRAAMATAVA